MFKFACVVASAAALTLQTPDQSYKAKKDTLATSLKVVAAQQAYEAKWEKDHKANMDRADSECQTLKSKVSTARER